MDIATQRFEFVVVYNDYAPTSDRFIATLGDYDLGAPTGTGSDAQSAIIDWLELHGDLLVGKRGVKTRRLYQQI